MFNRSYNHKDVLTRASITIQILEDVALYKAQLFSSNGNIFSSSDESSELYVRVYKGLDDITSKFTDIVWKRFTSSSNNVEEDLTWGDKYAGKTDITITKDDIKQKANIQVEIYSLINGERTLVAADFITFININDMQGSDLPPENPKHGDLWLDTSVTPPRLMMWDSNLGMWVEVAIAGRDRRNLIRHSNFYRKNFDYWNNVNNSILEIESMSGKKWAHIKSNIAQNDYCGISQTVSANAKGQYSFQMLSEIYIQSAYPNGDALVAFYSINSLGTKTLIKEETFDLKTDEKVFTSTFTTLEDTKQIEVIISGQKNTNFDFAVTNIKLENYPIPTEWELAIEDMQDALDQKVGNTPEEVFDSLTDGGKMQGIYVDIDEHGQKNYYISGRYIDAYNLVVRRKKDNIETLKVDEEGNVSLRVNNLQIISDTGECVNTATENDIDTIDNKVQTVKDSVAQINLDMNGITQRVEATETTTTNLNNKIDNIQVGGRNLIKNSLSIQLSGTDTSTNTTHQVIDSNNGHYKIIINNNNRWNRYQWLNNNIDRSFTSNLGEKYTISMDIKVNKLPENDLKFSFNVRASNSDVYGAHNDIAYQIKKPNVWIRIFSTVSLPTDNDKRTSVLALISSDAGGQQGLEIEYKNLKLEKGNTGTDWSPAPEDINDEILAVDSKATTISNKVSEITTNLDSITQRVSSTETTTTSLTNKLNELQIGGRNLIRLSNSFYAGSGSSNITSSINSDGYLQVVAQSGNGNWFTNFLKSYEGIENSFKEGEKFTISFTVKSPNSTAKPNIYIKSGMGYYPMIGDMSTEWSTIYYTGTWKKANSISMHLGFGRAIGTFIFKNIKLEKGNKATDWSPAPEDTKNEINTNIGLGKWRREIYDVGLANASTYPTFENIIGLNPTYIDEFTDNNTMLTGISASDTYVVAFKTNAYVSTSKTVTLTPNAAVDDTLTAYVNGIEIGRVNNTENINLPLKQGWNSITLLFYEHTGGEVLNFRTKLSDLVDKIAYGVNSNSVDTSITAVSSKVSEIKTDLNGITSRVGTVESKTTTLEKLAEKKLINNFSNSNTLDLWSAPGTTLKYSSIVGYYMDCLSNNLNYMIQSEYFEIDSSKSYKISLMQQFAPNSGTATFYFGIYAYDKDKNNIGVYVDKGTSLNTNPYFMNKRTPTNDYGNWRTWSGYIYSHDTIIQDYTPKGNVTSCMKFSPKTKFLRIRFLHYRNGSYGDSGQGSMYFAQPAIYEIDNQIVNTEQRLRTAEQKITDEAITNTVKQNFYTKGDVDNKGYQTASQVQQTVNQLQLKFTESGGYNLLYNTGFKNNTYSWSNNGGNLSIINEATSPTGKAIKIIASSGGRGVYQFYTPITTGYYTVSFYGRADTNLSFYFGQEGSTQKTVTLTTSWQKFTHTFDRRSLNRNAYVFYPNAAGTFYIHSILVEKGQLSSNWSPHPSEIYDGITTIDKDGITVTSSNVRSKTSMNASGFKITKTDTNEDVFKVNADGTLVMKGSITVTGGSVPTSNLTGTITANMISANAITTDKIATNAITADKINAGTITADKLKIQARDSFSVNPNFSLWSSTYPYGMSSWSSSTCTKVAVDNRNVLQYAVTNASTQMGAVLNTSYFNAGLNLDGMQYIGLEVKYRLTSGTNPAGACMLLDIHYTDNTYERLNLSLKSINSSVTTNTWYTAKKVFKVSNITKTFKRVSGYLLANWSSETNTVKTIQFASANAYACTEQDYLTQTWSSGTEINGAKIKTGTLSADKITTGTLDASKVNVTKLNASNITSGTIDASKITVTNLNANNITSGTIGGGYNLLKNGNAQGGLKYWVSNGGGISVVNSSKGSAFRTTLPSGIRHDDVQLKPNTDYVYSAYLHCSTAITGSSTTPLHFWCNATKGSAGIPACSIIKYSQKVPANTWTKVYVHIRTGNQDCWFRPFIYTGSGTGDITVRELGLYESSLNLPYSPHPSEIYDGITTIDKDGITVTSSNVNSKTSMTASGFKITKTDTNEDVFKVNSSGDLELYGIIRSRKDGQTRAEFKGDGIDFYSGSKSIGTISHDSTGAGTVSEARDRLWLRTENYALKLQAVRADCSLGANNLYLQANNIHLTPGKNTDNKVYIDGDLQVSGSLIATNVVAVFG